MFTRSCVQFNGRCREHSNTGAQAELARVCQAYRKHVTNSHVVTALVPPVRRPHIHTRTQKLLRHKTHALICNISPSMKEKMCIIRADTFFTYGRLSRSGRRLFLPERCLTVKLNSCNSMFQRSNF